MRLVRILCSVALLAVVCVAHAATNAQQRDRFAALVRQAKANLNTPAGRAYDDALSAHFGRHVGPVMQQCFANTTSPDPTSFEMVLRVASDGSARSVAVEPETNIGLCLKARLASQLFPVPPKGDYLAYMEMRLTP